MCWGGVSLPPPKGSLTLSTLLLPGVAYTSECFPCKPGTYAPAAGSSTCQLCPADTFSSKGATACQPCEPTTYAGERWQPRPLPCPLTLRWQPGSLVPQPLPCGDAPGEGRGDARDREDLPALGWGRTRASRWWHGAGRASRGDSSKVPLPGWLSCRLPHGRQSLARHPANRGRPAPTRITSTPTLPVTPVGRYGRGGDIRGLASTVPVSHPPQPSSAPLLPPGQTQLMFKWAEPKICTEELPQAAKLPPSGVKTKCPPCNPGFAKSNGSACQPCPYGSYSNGSGKDVPTIIPKG